jgi:FkbM family methyltransferase
MGDDVMAAEATTKTFEYRGAHITVHGSEHDAYFQAVEHIGLSNDLYTTALDVMSKRGVVLDIGANIGVTAMMAAQKAKRVYSFEPAPTTYKSLVQTIATNQMGHMVIPINVAIGAVAGELSFYNDPNSASASHLLTGDTLARQSSEQVKVMTLDRFASVWNIQQVDLIKIDVEGFEIDALNGGLDTISRLRPSAVIEFNAFTMIGFRDINPRRLLDLIRSTFPFVYRWQNGRPVMIRNDGEALGFIHDNLVGAGCVDDLYGTFCPLS